MCNLICQHKKTKFSGSRSNSHIFGNSTLSSSKRINTATENVTEIVTISTKAVMIHFVPSSWFTPAEPTCQQLATLVAASLVCYLLTDDDRMHTVDTLNNWHLIDRVMVPEAAATVVVNGTCFRGPALPTRASRLLAGGEKQIRGSDFPRKSFRKWHISFVSHQKCPHCDWLLRDQAAANPRKQPHIQRRISYATLLIDIHHNSTHILCRKICVVLANVPAKSTATATLAAANSLWRFEGLPNWVG